MLQLSSLFFSQQIRRMVDCQRSVKKMKSYGFSGFPGLKKKQKPVPVAPVMPPAGQCNIPTLHTIGFFREINCLFIISLFYR